jgi:hypothetical protein
MILDFTRFQHVPVLNRETGVVGHSVFYGTQDLFSPRIVCIPVPALVLCLSSICKYIVNCVSSH